MTTEPTTEPRTALQRLDAEHIIDESWRDADVLAAVKDGKPLGSQARARIVEWYDAATDPGVAAGRASVQGGDSELRTAAARVLWFHEEGAKVMEPRPFLDGMDWAMTRLRAALATDSRPDSIDAAGEPHFVDTENACRFYGGTPPDCLTHGGSWVRDRGYCDRSPLAAHPAEASPLKLHPNGLIGVSTAAHPAEAEEGEPPA